MERPNDNDDSTPRQSTNPNIFDDEYATEDFDLDFAPGVADGFRPRDDQRNAQRGGTDATEAVATRRSISISKAAESNLWRMSSRGSTAKPSLTQDQSPFSDNAAYQARRTPLQHRASISSAGSFATMARTESLHGNNGPSHPYGMYPQNTTIARSSSVTTSSTLRQPRRSLSDQHPAHPYGMYPQNVVEDPDEPSMAQPVPAIPVGFPGLSNGYHRRLGPDGEEQDIIGPDGHTEQLPPYTRYPEDGPTKASIAAEPISRETTPTQNRTIDPAPESPLIAHNTTPADEPRSQDSELEGGTQNQSLPQSGELSATERGGVEKSETEDSKKGLKRRLWGKVPLGVVLLLLVLVMVFAIILGAAIGTLAAKNKEKPDRHKKNPQDPEAQNTPTTTMFDASPIPSTPGLQPIPTGTFALPLGVAQESNPNCLTVGSQLSAWSCKMSLIPLMLTINATLPNGIPMPAVNVQGLPKPDGGIQYGVQAPSIPSQPLQLVIDMDYRSLGPAYHFQGTYNKVVVLDPDEFAAGQGYRRRGPRGDFHNRFQVQPGDTPWFCYWNQTFIEGYLYVNDNSSAATMTGPLMTNWPTSYPSSTPVSNLPSGTSISTATSPSSAAAATGNPAQPTTTILPALIARDGGDFPRMAPYPRIVKIEERRLPDTPQPYCQQMQLLDDGNLVPKMNAQNQVTKIMLAETDPPLNAFIGGEGGGNSGNGQSSSNNSNGSKRRDAPQKRDDPPTACHCQWLFQ